MLKFKYADSEGSVRVTDDAGSSVSISLYFESLKSGHANGASCSSVQSHSCFANFSLRDAAFVRPTFPTGS